MLRPLLYLARHGTTTDSGKDIFRGQRDSALDQKGFRDAHDLRDFFSDKKYHRIFTSDLTRAIQTGRVIAGDDEDQMMPPVRGLRPWDIGYLTGKPKEQYGDDMKSFMDRPDVAPQGGESRNDFERGRIFPLLIDGIRMGEQGDPPIIVGHSSVVHALAHLLYGEDHKDMAVKPGGVMEVYLEGGEIQARPVLKKGHDDSSYSAAS